MAQVNVYRWDDIGAPQIVEGRPSEYLSVLKKCLVEGYGTKSAAGWSIAHESLPEEAPYLAVQNDSVDGSGGYMTFLSSNDNVNANVRCQSALDFINTESMSRLGSYFYFGASSAAADYMLKNWMVLATNKAFYFFAFPSFTANRNYFGTYTATLFFVGDINSAYPNDPSRFVTLYGVNDNDSFGWNSGLHYLFSQSESSICGYVYRLDGTESKSNAYIVSSFGSYMLHQSSLYNESPNIRVLSPLTLTSGNRSLSSSGTRCNSSVDPYFRGYVPGLFASQETGFLNQNMPYLHDVEGQLYFNVPSANSNSSNVWINTQEW